MECRDLTERISAYVDGEAAPAEAREVEAHLEGCAECRTLERRMRSVGTGVARIETAVSPDFREKLFARMEAEELLPRRRSLFVFSLRWAAVPLAAAAALALFLLTTTEKGREFTVPQGKPPQVAQREPVAEPGFPAPPAATPRAPSPSPGVPRPSRQPAVAAVPKAEEPGAPVVPKREQRMAVATARGAAELSPEERDIVANLDVLEDPTAMDEPGEVDELEIFGPAGRRRG